MRMTLQAQGSTISIWARMPMVPGGGEGGEGAGVAHFAHQAGGPPAADEKAEEMGGAEQADLGRGKTERLARDGIERGHASGAELQQDDRQEERGEGDQEAHGGPAGDRAT